MVAGFLKVMTPEKKGAGARKLRCNTSFATGRYATSTIISRRKKNGTKLRSESPIRGVSKPTQGKLSARLHSPTTGARMPTQGNTRAQSRELQNSRHPRLP